MHIFRLPQGVKHCFKFRGNCSLNVKVFIHRKLERSSFTIPPGLSISVLPEAQRQLPDSLTGDEAHGEKMRFDLGDTEQIRNEKLIPPPHPTSP